ncbi:hypothetical protein [Frankia sp. CiP3]|uniref:hypothetical protein n=1 Tax=Frankia sp. CiP3 TaxID=2880971 RepID=UPI001EF69619|nr:hypothetical protein [Frankia sp. CiP3]
MRWLLIDCAVVLLTCVALGALAYRLFSRVRLVTSEVGKLRDRLAGLTDETAALAGRLDAAEASARLGERASASRSRDDRSWL